MSFTVVTANIQKKASAEELRTYFRGRFLKPMPRARVGPPPTSIGTFQEFLHGVDNFKRVMPPWWQIMSVFPPQPFAFDSRIWDLREMEGDLVYEKTFVGQKGAGPARLTERHVQWLKLRARYSPRAYLHVLNLHAAPSKQVPKQKGAEYSRDELQEMLFNAIAAKADEVGTPVLVMGDFNVKNWKDENLDPFRESGFKVAGPRDDIDRILYRGGVPQSRRYQLKYIRGGETAKVVNSDVHNPRWAEFEILKPVR